MQPGERRKDSKLVFTARESAGERERADRVYAALLPERAHGRLPEKRERERERERECYIAHCRISRTKEEGIAIVYVYSETG